MASLNKVILIGNLTRDPEVRYTPKGTPVTDIGLAVNRSWSNDQGERMEETTFIDVTLWGRQAEVVGKYFNKGKAIFIEGRLRMDTWEDKQTGQKRSKIKVVGESFQFLPDGRGGGHQQNAAQAAPQQAAAAPAQATDPAPAQAAPTPAPAPADMPDDEGDEIPF